MPTMEGGRGKIVKKMERKRRACVWGWGGCTVYIFQAVGVSRILNLTMSLCEGNIIL
jgi:hypothetical protein